MNSRLLLSLALLYSFLSSCMFSLSGEGPITESSRSLDEFKQLRVKGFIEVEYHPSSESRLQLITHENLHDQIEIEVLDGLLSIAPKRNIRSAESLKIILYGPALERLETTGAVRFSSVGSLRAPQMRILSSGAAQIEAELELHRLWLELSGATQVQLKGQVKEASYQLTGASKVFARELETEELSLRSNGAGRAEIWVTKALVVQADGATQLAYRGDPPLKQINVSGLARLDPLDTNSLDSP